MCGSKSREKRLVHRRKVIGQHIIGVRYQREFVVRNPSSVFRVLAGKKRRHCNEGICERLFVGEVCRRLMQGQGVEGELI